ncbi:hypothetical protein D3C73_1526890 [compost metagenome]
MLIQVIAPCARLMVRLNQFQLQRPHIKKSQLRPRLCRPPVIAGLGNVGCICNNNLRLLQSKKLRIRRAYLLHIIHQNPNLCNEMIAKNS